MNKDTYKRTYLFQKPEYIPFGFHINAACWDVYEPGELENIIDTYPFIFYNIKRSARTPSANVSLKHTDEWGCIWETSMRGITGAVVGHPLQNWSDFSAYIPPKPIINIDHVRQSWQSNQFTSMNLEHGFFFLRLAYIRGFENLMIDMYEDEPELQKLMYIVEEYQMQLIDKFVTLRPDMIHYPEDLGTQTNLMIPPSMLRKYILPSYQRLIKRARENDIIAYFHTDGHVLSAVDDLLNCGIQVLNIQDLVNGIDEIRKYIKGRCAIALDLDRQKVTRFGSPGDIDDLIHEEVVKLGSPEGGLSFVYGLYPGIPLANIRAICDAYMKYYNYYTGR
jgi:hypothetical protein